MLCDIVLHPAKAFYAVLYSASVCHIILYYAHYILLYHVLTCHAVYIMLYDFCTRPYVYTVRRHHVIACGALMYLFVLKVSDILYSS